MDTLKIATYNVGNFGGEITGYSCKEIARYMKEQEVDVLCFQECGDNKYFPMDSIRNVFSHWRYALIPTEDSIRGVLPIAVFSRYPLVNPQFISYQQSANCSMQCDIVLGRDTVRLLNNHLQTTSVSQNRRKWERGLANSNNTRREAEVVQGAITSLHANFVKRAEQTDSIRQLVIASPYPVLACGDFNSLPSSYTYAELSDVLKDGFRTSGRGYMYTYRYFKRLLRIDYIFHSPGKPYLKTSVFETFKSRIPWLLLLMVSATFTGQIIAKFEDALGACAILTAYIPMLMDTGGNCGSQASVTVIRGISLDEIEFSDLLRVIWKEIRVAVLCAAVLSAANFVKLLLVDKMIFGNPITMTVAAVICLTLIVTVFAAKLVGCTLPLLAKKIGFDPAVMASPFITTVVDAISLAIYFRFASLLLGI